MTGTSVRPAGTQRRSRRPLVLALVAVCLCFGVIAVLLTRPRDEPAATSTPTRTVAATPTRTADSAIGDGVSAAPAVVANPKVGGVDFT